MPDTPEGSCMHVQRFVHACATIARMPNRCQVLECDGQVGVPAGSSMPAAGRKQCFA